MSEKIDRRIGNNDLLLLVVVILVIAAAAGLFLWQRMNNSSSSEPGQQGEAPPDQILQAGELHTFTIYYPLGEALTAADVKVHPKPDAQAQARDVLSAVLADARSVQFPVFTQIKLREFFLDDAGTAYADLLPVAQNGIKASASEELLAIYAMVNTLLRNFEEIKGVRFLVEGKEVQTLAGHIDLLRTFDTRMDLVK